MMMTVITAIGSDNGLNFDSEQPRLLNSISISVEVWIILIPYFTFVFVEILLRALIGSG